VKAEELNAKISNLIESYENMQEFANLASPHKNWKLIDKNLNLPSDVGFAEEKCPYCYETIRLIHDKFSTTNYELPLTCPFCKETIKCKIEFEGYTSGIYLKRK